MKRFIVKLPISATQIARLTISAPGWFEAASIAMLRFPCITPRAISIKPIVEQPA